MTGQASRISVIIPFFQRESGLLERALRSALSQDMEEDFEIIVVDDASPSPPAADLVRLSVPGRIHIRIVGRENGGPSAARNTGLDGVAPGTEYVAFLDSDDEWDRSHLRTAIFALDRGFDFYFANYMPLGSSRSMFELRGILPQDHELLWPDRPLYRYRGDLFDDILSKGHVGAPTVAYRFSKFPDLRFPGDVVTSGDNYLWLKLALATDHIVFSSAVTVRCGSGVNIFAGSGWGTDGALTRIWSDLRIRKAYLRDFALTPPQVESTLRIIRRHRNDFIENLLHRVRGGKRIDWRMVLRFFRMDPAAALCVVPVLARMGARKLTRRA